MGTFGLSQRVALNLLRIFAGFMFMQHGLQKVFGLLGRDPVESFFSLIGLAGVIELVGGALIMLGLFTRAVAFVCSGEMAVAYLYAHLPRGFWPAENGGELAAMYCFAFFLLWAFGGGEWSLDGMLRERRATAVDSTL